MPSHEDEEVGYLKMECHELRVRVGELEEFKRKVAVAWEAHKDCGPECSLNDELEVILNP